MACKALGKVLIFSHEGAMKTYGRSYKEIFVLRGDVVLAHEFRNSLLLGLYWPVGYAYMSKLRQLKFVTPIPFNGQPEKDME